MSSYQIVWLIITTPLFFALGVIFLYNGRDMVENKNFHASPVEWIKIWLVKMTEGKKAAEQYKSKIIADQKNLRHIGYKSIFSGFVYLIIGIYFASLLIIEIK